MDGERERTSGWIERRVDVERERTSGWMERMSRWIDGEKERICGQGQWQK